MKHINEIFEKLESMKETLETFLEKTTDNEEELVVVKEILEKVKTEIRYFDNDNFAQMLKNVTSIIEEFENLDLTIDEPHYYDFGYFFSSKDSGSIRVTLNVKLDVDDVDECVEIALKNNEIDEEYANNIVYVEELTREEAEEMGFFS